MLLIGTGALMSPQSLMQGKTIPAFETPVETQYERKALSAESAAAIPCKEVLGAYIVRFRRQ